MTVNGFPIDMELDTGASLLVMSEEMFAKLHSNGKLPKLQITETVRQYFVLTLGRKLNQGAASLSWFHMKTKNIICLYSLCNDMGQHYLVEIG